MSDLPTPLAVDSKEAARLLGIGERTLWTLTNAGAIPCVRIHATGVSKPAKRYLVSDLREYLERLRAKAVR